MTNEYIDRVREEFMEEWRGDARTYYVWHRDFKDHKDHNNPFKGQELIVISPEKFWLFHSDPKMWYAPFIYKGVLIRLNDGRAINESN